MDSVGSFSAGNGLRSMVLHRQAELIAWLVRGLNRLLFP